MNPFDPFFRWVESTSFSMWLTGSPSLFAFPAVLTVHTIGLGLLAGLNGALDFRLLGAVRGVPPRAFLRYLPVMWFGLWINVATGIALVIAYPTKALTNPVFYLKLAMIGVALLILRIILRRVRAGEVESRSLSRLALCSLIVWAAVITAGRLLAYTCTRLMVDLACS